MCPLLSLFLMLLLHVLSLMWPPSLPSTTTCFHGFRWTGHWARTCTTVRGKPSKMKPVRHSGVLMLSAISPTTISSDTSAPASIASLACTAAGPPVRGMFVHES